jgi:hypothetical protein
VPDHAIRSLAGHAIGDHGCRSGLAGTLADVQLNMGVNGLDFGCRIRRSGPRIAEMISKTMLSKPTSADSNQRAFALAA